MNEYSKELCHWGVELGAKRDNHKYIARVETRPGRYLYFYDMAKYNAWKNGAKNKVQDAAKNIKNKAQNIGESARNAGLNAAKNASNAIKTSSNKVNEKTRAVLKNGGVKLSVAVNKYKKFISSKAQETAESARNELNNAKNTTVKKAKDTYNTAANELQSRASKAYNDASSEIKKQAPAVKRKAADTVDKAVSTAKEKATKIASKAMENDAVQKAYDTAKPYTDKVRNEIQKVYDSYKSRAIKEIKATATSVEGRAVIDAINTVAGKKLIDITKFEEPKTPAKTFDPDKNNRNKGYGSDDRTKAATAKVEYYRQNEPSFMHGISRIKLNDDGTWPTTAEMVSAVNPGYKMTNDKGQTLKASSINCFHCTTAYDLRKRGYDVSAASAASRFGDTWSLDNFYDIEQQSKSDWGKASSDEINVQKAIVNIDGSKPAKDGTIEKDYQIHAKGDRAKAFANATESGTLYCPNGTTDNKGNSKSIVPTKAIADYCKQQNIDTSDAKAMQKVLNSREAKGKAIGAQLTAEANKYPSNSWGRVGIAWANGGGHSFVWEKDYDGTVRFLDSQTNKEVDISDYAGKASLYDTVDLIRTDNLQLKDKVIWFANDRKEGYATENNSKYQSIEDQKAKKEGKK